jgi:hypothetical protein
VCHGETVGVDVVQHETEFGQILEPEEVRNQLPREYNASRAEEDDLCHVSILGADARIAQVSERIPSKVIILRER